VTELHRRVGDASLGRLLRLRYAGDRDVTRDTERGAAETERGAAEGGAEALEKITPVQLAGHLVLLPRAPSATAMRIAHSTVTSIV